MRHPAQAASAVSLCVPPLSASDSCLCLENVVCQIRGHLRSGRPGKQRGIEFQHRRISALPHKRRGHLLDKLPPTLALETEPQRGLALQLQRLPDVQRGPGSADVGDRSPQGIAAAGYQHVHARNEVEPGRPPSFYFGHVILLTFPCAIWPWASPQERSSVWGCAWPWVWPQPWSPTLSTDPPNRGPVGGARVAWPRWPWP